MHILIQGDLNEDKSISKKELFAMLSGWFDAMDREKAGGLSKAAFIKSLPDAFFPSGEKPLGRIPEPYVAAGLFTLADSDGDGIATKQSLTSSFAALLERMDLDDDGKLNEHLLMVGLRSLIQQSRNATN